MVRESARYFFYIALAALIYPAMLLAQDIQIRSEVDSRSVELGQPFQFHVIIEGQVSGRVVPEILGGDEFELMYLGTQSSVSIINGSATQETSFTYELTPKKIGVLSTPIAELSIDGNMYRSKPIQVSVRKASDGQNTSATDDIIFLRQSVSKKRVYVGEQLPLSIHLFHAVDLLEANFLDLRFDRFWAESFGKERVTRKRLKNNDYTVHELRKALFALSPGNISIEPKSIEVKYHDPRSRRGPDIFGFGSGLFDGVFGAKAKKQVFRSNSLEIEVLPLPPAPQDFPVIGNSPTLVGLSSLSLKIEKMNLDAGESTTLTLVIESEGNLSPLQEFKLEIEGARVYEESPESQEEIRQGRLVSRRIFRYSVVPTRAGIIQIPEIRLGYFDPESQAYEIVHSEGRQISVRSNGQTQDLFAPQSKSLAPAAPVQQTELGQPSYPSYQEQSAIERLSSQIGLGLAVLIIFVAILVSAALIFILLLLRKRALRVRLRSAIASASNEDALRRSFEEYLSKFVFRAHAPGPRALLQEQELNGDLKQNLEYVYQQLDLLLYSQISAAERQAGLVRIKNGILELFDRS